MFQILVPITEGSEEIEAIALVDILRRAKANVVIAAAGNSLEVVGSRNAKLVADVLLEEVAEKAFDLIVLPVSSANFYKSQRKFCDSLTNNKNRTSLMNHRAVLTVLQDSRAARH